MGVFFLLFIIFCALYLYTLAVYPGLLLVLNAIGKPPDPSRQSETHSITMIVPARNEEAAIEEKINNFKELDYPPDKKSLVIVSDGSTDRTYEIASYFKSDDIRVIKFEIQKGKSAAENAALAVSKGDILLFSDATSILEPDAFKKLSGRFDDPKTGFCSGEVVYSKGNDTKVSFFEKLYWLYETGIRRAESRLNMLITGSGAFSAVRRPLAGKLPEDMGEDFYLPLYSASLGYKNIHCGDIKVHESPADNKKSEYALRVRMISKDFRAVMHFSALLNIFIYPGPAASLISKKLLRWFSGLWLAGIFITNIMLAGDLIFNIILLMQISAYSYGFSGILFDRFFNVFSYLILNYAAALAGIYKTLTGRPQAKWETIR